MTQVIFDFSELITNCLHNEEAKFTNAISPEIDSKVFISELFQNFKLTCQETDLKKLLKQEHFHLLQEPYNIGKIEELVGNPYLDYNRLCQVPLSQEFRLYGNLQKIKHTNFHLFKALILDPNHLIYNEQKFKKLENMVCLFSEANCLATKKMTLKKKKSR